MRKYNSEEVTMTHNIKCNKNNVDSVKIVMLGACGVGKSALVVRYLTRRFIWEYDPTLECAYKHQTLVDDEQACTEILDTAGEVDPCSLHLETQMRWGEGFIMVYSVTDRHSFDIIPQIKQVLDDVKAPRSPQCILVGNKMDLEHARQVSFEEGEKMAMELSCGFLETSACDGGEEVEDAFHEVYREVKRRKLMDSKPRRRSSVQQQVSQVFNKMLTKIQNG